MDSNYKARTKYFAAVMRPLFVLIAVTGFVCVSYAQADCVSGDRIAVLLADIRSGKAQSLNTALRDEIHTMKTDLVTQTAQQFAAQTNTLAKDKAKAAKPVQASTTDVPKRICEILNSNPWPTKSVVETQGASDFVKLVKRYLSVEQQRALLPVIAAGIDRGEIPKDEEAAAFVDRLRLRLGVPQLFGTQMTEDKGFLVLYPLQSEANLDAWRKEYGMSPLRDYLQKVQNFYRKQVIRSTAKVKRVPINKEAVTPDGSAPINSETDGDVVKVETSVVTIDATISGTNIPKLTKDDFKIYEDGKPQQIAALNASDSPFDIVLLLDLSGSTSDKVALIKKTTKRFIEMKRDIDRVAIVTFNSTQNVVSPLESDKQKLFDSLSKIKGVGASRVWDSEKFAIDMLRRDSPSDRRKAIVVMTDGIDNDLFYTPGPGSDTMFGDLVEDVRNGQTAIFPIFLNPNGPGGDGSRLVDDARRTKPLLADDSGGTFYTTANLESLNEVYERVMQDVGRVYSIVYEPSSDLRDGTWRTIKVEIPSHPELKVRARSGYYAK
jgi:VWFA-related protein